MGKGLPRSLSGAKGKNALKVMHVSLAGVMSVSATSTAVGFGTKVIGDFPEGNILFLGAVANVKFTAPDTTPLIAAFAGDYSIGTVPTGDNDLADSGEANIISSTEILADTSVTPLHRGSGSTLAIFDNTDGSLELNLNVLIDASSIADDGTEAALAISGDAWIAYAVLGDD